MQIEIMPIDEIIPYENNAKLHPEWQIEQIAKSIQQFGFNDPLSVWQNESGENIVVEGHGRLLAAQKLKINEVPVIKLNNLTDEQRRAYTHIHNQINMNTGFDFEKLDEDLSNLDFDFSSFGFSELDKSGNYIDEFFESGYTSEINTDDFKKFSVSFVFPKEYKNEIKKYIKEFTKEQITAHIIDEALKWE